MALSTTTPSMVTSLCNPLDWQNMSNEDMCRALALGQMNVQRALNDFAQMSGHEVKSLRCDLQQSRCELQQATHSLGSSLDDLKDEVKRLALESNKYYSPGNAEAGLALLLAWSVGFMTEQPNGKPHAYTFAFPVHIEQEPYVILLGKPWYLMWRKLHWDRKVSIVRFQAALQLCFPQWRAYSSLAQRKVAQKLLCPTWAVPSTNVLKAVPAFLVIPWAKFLKELEQMVAVMKSVHELAAHESFQNANAPAEVYQRIFGRMANDRHRGGWVENLVHRDEEVLAVELLQHNLSRVYQAASQCWPILPSYSVPLESTQVGFFMQGVSKDEDEDSTPGEPEDFSE